MKNSALLILSFYLSKYGSKNDPRAYNSLGYKNATAAFVGLAETLHVPKNTVKNYCDTFDPLHTHRKGWHKNAMPLSHKRISDSLKDFEEEKLGKICSEIITNTSYREGEKYLSDLNISGNDNFEDLSQLFLDLQEKSKQIDLLEIDQKIPPEMQEKIREAAKNTHQITFESYCTKLIIKGSKNKLVVPNLAFFMAIEALPIFNAINEFNKVFVSIYEKLKSSGKITSTKAEDFYKDIIKTENSTTIRKLFEEASLSYLNEVGKGIQENIDFFNKFIYEKKWKSAGLADGKNPGRPDTWKSSVLTAYGTSHEKQGFICELVDILGKSSADFSTYSLLDGNYESGSVESPKNLIVYGAPGTGKSHYLNNLLKDSSTIRTVFHSETQNSDFVGSLKPVTDTDGKVTYEFVVGPFIKALLEALKQPDKQVHLIIEEINRANAAAVFGEIFQLLDRDASGKSSYAIQADELLSRCLKDHLDPNFDGLIRIPSNLIINATMNSSDQGVYPLDSAFKRRWSFKYMPIDFQSSPKGMVALDGRRLTWDNLAESINEILSKEYAHLEEDRFIGPWFLNKDEVQSQFSNAIESKLFTYLWNDVLRHQQRGKIFNEQSIATFGDLIKVFNRQQAGEEVYIFSDLVHSAFDRHIEASTPYVEDGSADVEDDDDE